MPYRRKPLEQRTFGTVTMNDQEKRLELRRFLQDRRSRVTPADAGIPAIGRRRVPGLRREEVAMLAGIGVSWYTVLESGDASGVSEQTVLAVANALRLSVSERNYLRTLTGIDSAQDIQEPGPLLEDTMNALAFPAYIIVVSWDVRSCNTAFRRVWEIDENERDFNSVERLFLDPRARKLHGEHFVSNVTPVVAMVRSAVGRRPHLPALQRLREQFAALPETRDLWDAYELRDPQEPNICTIDSPIGAYTYEGLTLAYPGTTAGLVIHVPDAPSRSRLAEAMRRA